MCYSCSRLFVDENSVLECVAEGARVVRTKRLDLE